MYDNYTEIKKNLNLIGEKSKIFLYLIFYFSRKQLWVNYFIKTEYVIKNVQVEWLPVTGQSR